MGQKITFMTSVCLPDEFFLLFLKDGSVKQIKIDTNKIYLCKANDIVTVKKVAIFPVPTKAVSTSIIYFIS